MKIKTKQQKLLIGIKRKRTNLTAVYTQILRMVNLLPSRILSTSCLLLAMADLYIVIANVTRLAISIART